MINADMREYDFYLYGAKDSFGQPQLTEESQGIVKIAINTTNQSVQDNITYKDANYIGITQALINDSYVIQFGEERLKVLYVQPKGRFKQVFLKKI